MFRISYNERELANIEQRLALFRLTPKKRRTLMVRMSTRGIIPLARKNIKAQQAPDGTPFRARKRGKKKMYVKLPKYLTAESSTESASVTRFKRASGYDGGRSSPGIVARSHHDGASIKRTSSQARTAAPQRGPCSAMQAKRLKKLGYKRAVESKIGKDGQRQRRYASASLKWMRDNLTRGQAGILIRKLSGTTPKKSWTIDLPERPLLGATKEDVSKILARELRSIQYGGRGAV